MINSNALVKRLVYRSQEFRDVVRAVMDELRGPLCPAPSTPRMSAAERSRFEHLIGRAGLTTPLAKVLEFLAGYTPADGDKVMVTSWDQFKFGLCFMVEDGGTGWPTSPQPKFNEPGVLVGTSCDGPNGSLICYYVTKDGITRKFKTDGVSLNTQKIRLLEVEEVEVLLNSIATSMLEDTV